MKTALILALCYLIGSIPFGVIMGRLRGIDIQKHGSGNIGATNVLRTLGVVPAIIVFILDAMKGCAAVLICDSLHMGQYIVVAGALLAIVGHTFSVFLKFTGGKAVSTSLGVIIGLNWIIALIAFLVWCALVAITRYVSIASMIAAMSVPVMMICWKAQHVPPAYQALAVLAALAIVIKHKSNMKRLMQGTESKIGQKVDTSKAKEEISQ
ncbi:MAG: glycerol-3-phosphate 1-O-acyltransferase PlsY [Armatimonadota bacterium]